MQISLFRDDEHSVGLDEQFFRNQLDRHRGEAREDFMESRGDGSEVVDDDDGPPKSAGRFCNKRIYASRPPAEPPTQTTGKSLAAPLADRKSTRLNSSHANISY